MQRKMNNDKLLKPGLNAEDVDNEIKLFIYFNL